MAETEQQSGFVAWVRAQSGIVRALVFTGIMVAILLGLILLATGIFYLNVQNIPRVASAAILNDVTVSEHVIFEDEQAYPGALATAPDGTLYIGSFATGAVWSADAEGNYAEIPATREQIGSVIGLDVDAEGTLYVLDRIDPLTRAGAIVWQITSEGDLTQMGELPLDGRTQVIEPNDIAVDDAGNVYVVDWALERVMRLDPNGDASIWWVTRDDTGDPAPTALAYSAADDSLLIGDLTLNTIYRVPTTATDTFAATETIYRHDRAIDTPGINGLTVAPDGTLYVAALDVNRVGRIGDDGELVYLAGAFRGASDVAYVPTQDRLYVNNWDQRWLQPVSFLFFNFDVGARLPFSVDAVQLSAQ